MTSPTTPVAFLHGWLGCAEDFAALAEQSALSNLTLQFIDLPGHSASAALPVSIATTVQILADTLSERTHLVGYSMGGRIALAFAAAHPQRLASLTLLAAHPGISESERAGRRAVDAERAASLRRDPADFLARWSGLPMFGPRTAPAWRAVQARRLATGVARAEGWARALECFSVAEQADLWDVAGAAGVRTLYAAGALDEKYCEVGRRLAAHPAVRVAIVEQSHHALHLDQPGRTAQQVGAFINGV